MINITSPIEYCHKNSTLLNTLNTCLHKHAMPHQVPQAVLLSSTGEFKNSLVGIF
jgi:hypothetical protein